jgi:hypothetical protein
MVWSATMQVSEVWGVGEVATLLQEGWMVRYDQLKIDRSFVHARYFVLESRLLGYYKKKFMGNMLVT